VGDAPESSFAAVLRRLRTARSLTQEELAERAGLTVKAVGALERGERTHPYPHTVRSLADALDLDDVDRAALLAAVPPRAARAPRSVGNLSASLVPVSTLFGRDQDVERLCELVRAGRRLVTVTGPGGVGKTRVAAEVMARLGPTFAGGTGMVDLTSMREPSLVLERVATALDVPEGGVVDPMSRLVPALLGRRLLVLLDNFEHLLGAAGSVADLVAQCPDLVVLVTSRAPLRVRSEHEVPLQPLPVPTRDSYEDVLASAAGQLFLDRTSAAGRGVELDTENAAAIAEICRRLDGLPLALELAAAGARLLTPSALLARLDELERTPGPRDLAERQRTMTAALDWSLDLLGPEQVGCSGGSPPSPTASGSTRRRRSPPTTICSGRSVCSWNIPWSPGPGLPTTSPGSDCSSPFASTPRDGWSPQARQRLSRTVTPRGSATAPWRPVPCSTVPGSSRSLTGWRPSTPTCVRRTCGCSSSTGSGTRSRWRGASGYTWRCAAMPVKGWPGWPGRTKPRRRLPGAAQ
jgi:transcriptional regulator with XRE-family HTH domain